MVVAGESVLLSCTSFIGKKGQELFSSKFYDNEGEEIFTLFTDETMYQELCKIKKNTPVVLRMSWVPGNKYVQLMSVEVIKK